MIIQYRPVYLIFLTMVLAQEDDKEIDERIERENANFDDTSRRFMDNFNDEEWHIAHLKPTDFENRRSSGCREETFQEKVKKYRNRLKNDPGNIEFVSAAALPVSEKDLISDVCIGNDDRLPSPLKPLKKYDKVSTTVVDDKGRAKDNDEESKEVKARSVDFTKNETKMVNTTEKEVKEESLSKKKDKTQDIDKKEIKDTATTTKTSGDNKAERDTDKKEIKDTVTTPKAPGEKKSERDTDEKEIKDTATTPKAIEEKKAERDTDKKEIKDTATTPEIPGKKKKAERRSDYLFSSVEYAEDVAVFNKEDCPDTVEVIQLEEDIIKAYDVECELTLEWRSLE